MYQKPDDGRVFLHDCFLTRKIVASLVAIYASLTGCLLSFRRSAALQEFSRSIHRSCISGNFAATVRLWRYQIFTFVGAITTLPLPGISHLLRLRLLPPRHRVYQSSSQSQSSSSSSQSSSSSSQSSP